VAANVLGLLVLQVCGACPYAEDMLRPAKSILIYGFVGGLSCYAGLVTTAAADAYQLGGRNLACSTLTLANGAAVCSASVGTAAAAFGSSTASYGAVAAFIQGGAGSPGYEAQASAAGTFSDSLTIFGGVGQGVLEIAESSLMFGTGSLAEGNLSFSPVTSTIAETFTFGTPFSISLSAVASSTFDGSRGDGGSLLIEKSIESLTVDGLGSGHLSYSDISGHSYPIIGSGAGNSEARVIAVAPEPGAWVMGVIGLGLLWVGRRKTPGSKEANKGRT
jgi:MYXO-CTERM domain-containing protein